MQQAYGQGFDIMLFDQAGQGGQGAGEIKWNFNPAVVMATLVHLGPPSPWHQGLGKDQTQVKNVIAFFPGHIEDIPETTGGQHAGARTLAFDHRIGDQGGTMHDLDHGGQVEFMARQQAGRTLQHRPRGIVRRG